MGEFGSALREALSGLDAELDRAGDVDTLARAVLRCLQEVPGVVRAGLALNEGGGRRLRFLPSDAANWCHIDAYDDVPLTRVVRRGAPVVGDVDDFGGRYAGLLERQRAAGVQALAALPLPGPTEPLGGLIVYVDQQRAFDHTQLQLLDDVARRVASAVRRVRRLDAAAQAEIEGGIQGGVQGGVHQPALSYPHRASVQLTGDPRAPRAARHFLRDVLATWQVGDQVLDSAELCLSELVTNAVVHAGTVSVLTLALEDDLLTVEVRDRGAGEVPVLVEDDDPLRVFGRGLQLVDALSERWGTERDESGTLSWFALRVGSAA